jgi:hypothetical protein
MAYGDRKVNKLPSEFNFSDYFGLSFAGALGIVIAMLVDLQQSADASALFVINRWMGYLGAVFGFGELPLYSVLLIMMGIGALSIFYFQPVSFQAAFAQGFGVLAALMTIAPSDLGGALSAPMDEALPPPAAEASLDANYMREAAWGGGLGGFAMQQGLQHAVYGPEPRMDYRQQPHANPARYTSASYQDEKEGYHAYNITIVVELPDGLPRDLDAMIRSGTIRGRLFNEETGKSYNIFRNGGAVIEDDGDSITIRSSLPGMEQETTLWARIEVSRYAIAVESFDAVKGDNPVWTIAMTPNRTPLFLQRLRNSYWF